MMRAFAYVPIVLPLALALALAGCKGKPVYKDTPDTLAKLESLTQQLEEKDKAKKQCEADLAALQRGQAAAGEIVVSIEGDILKVRPGRGGGGAPPIDDATAAKQSQAFLDMVSRSRGAIQKCYEQALKKNTTLQAHAITVTIMASFTPQGAYQNASFSSSSPLDATFETCMKTIASKWQLSPSQVSTFKTQVSLTPS